MQLKRNRIELALFWTFLLGGILARLYRFWDIPFSNDELSALNRLNFTSFSDMIQKAVYTDGHPALVQSFLYGYTQLFGTEQWVIKLPFILLGSASLPLYFFAAKKLSSTQTALFVLAAMAFLQFPIAYSQSIRPYSSGLFFSSLTVFFWASFLKEPKSITTLLLFSMAIALGWSNHYFNFIQSLLLIPASWFMNRDSRSFKFLFPWIIATALYIPQLSIFIHHITVGSPGWLPIPTIESLVHHIAYTFQFSKLSLTWGLIPVFTAIANRRYLSKNQWIFLGLYAITIAFTFAYSVFRAPLFQDSIFVFSLFFLFLFLGDLFAESAHSLFKMGWIVGFGIVNLFNLIVNRDHYTQFYHQGYRELVKSTYFFEDKTLSIPVVVYGFEPFFFNYYKSQNLQKSIKDIQFLREIPNSAGPILKRIRTINPHQIIIAKAIDGPSEPLIELQLKFPYVYKQLAYGSEVLLFSDTPISHRPYLEKTVQTKILQKTVGPLISNEEWLPSIQCELKNSLSTRTARYVLTLCLDSVNPNSTDSLKSISADLRIAGGGQELRFCSVASRFMYKGKYYLIATTDGYHFDWNNAPSIHCKAYVVNPTKMNLHIHQFSLSIYNGNKSIYSLVNDFCQ